MTYLLLKLLHILSAIVVVGWHATYGFWVVRGSAHLEALPFVLRNIRWLDAHLAMPAFGLLIVTGLGMVWTGGHSLGTPWLGAGFGLLLVILVAHVAVYRPTIARMIRLLDTVGLDSPDYQAAAQREARLGQALVLAMVVVVYLMVMKPVLWG